MSEISFCVDERCVLGYKLIANTDDKKMHFKHTQVSLKELQEEVSPTNHPSYLIQETSKEKLASDIQFRSQRLIYNIIA
jgi:hypothetical protein